MLRFSVPDPKFSASERRHLRSTCGLTRASLSGSSSRRRSSVHRGRIAQMLLATVDVGVGCALGHQVQQFALQPIEIAQRAAGAAAAALGHAARSGRGR